MTTSMRSVYALAAALLCWLNIGSSATATERPNIVLIMADDAGAECFGCYGGESYSTPNVDSLAAAGVRFTHCYAQPLCTPSRVKLMTGLSNVRNYVNFGILKPGQQTFGHMLQSAGYRTCVVGKWQLYGPDEYGALAGKGTLPVDAGFDEYCLWQVDRRQERYWNPVIIENGEYLDDTGGKYGPDIFWEYAAAFIQRNRERPFFLYYPMCLPHNPFLPTPDSADRASTNRPQNFADMIAYTDKNVGRIVDKLDALGMGENTVVIFICDNGTNRSITSRANGRGVRGGKGLTTDAGMHVPLVVRWPTVVQAGRICNDLVDFSDFLPTLADATGAKLPVGVTPDGRSFLPQLRGEAGSPRDWIFCYYYPRPERAGTVATRFAQDRRWKLYDDGRLFEMDKDILEHSPLSDADLSREAAVARERLRAAIDSFPERRY